jgi:hypothetical protein
MSARLVLTATLHKPAETRKSKNGNEYITFTLRENNGGLTRWWQAISFSERAIEILREISAGEPVAVAGEFNAETYAPAGAEARVNLRIVIDGVLTARKPKQKPTPENGNQSFKQRVRERLLPELEDALNEGVSAADSGRRTAECSWAAPTRAAVETPHPHAGKGAINDDIPF